MSISSGRTGTSWPDYGVARRVPSRGVGGVFSSDVQASNRTDSARLILSRLRHFVRGLQRESDWLLPGGSTHSGRIGHEWRRTPRSGHSNFPRKRRMNYRNRPGAEVGLCSHYGSSNGQRHPQCRAPTELFSQHLILSQQILDCVLLVSIDPAGQNKEQQQPGFEHEVHN